MLQPIPTRSKAIAARGLRRARRHSPVEAWPPPAEWTERERAQDALTFRRLGVEAKQFAKNGVRRSQAMNILGPDLFAEFAVVRAPGRVIWCNFDLARALGFSVPRSNELTAELHEQLINALSFRAVQPKDDIRGQDTITMYADRYGGEGVSPALGAGRAGFLPYGNLYVKGVGFTPLFKHDDPDDFVHSHGAVHLDDCLSEALLGEVNENLFTSGSSRVVAIIDQGLHVTAPRGERIPIALAVRAGAQLRPAHLMSRHTPGRALLEKFVRMTRATGQLVTRRDERTGAELPDVRATMLQIIDDHARIAAESFRWRTIHGALSSSNMEMGGAMLDLPTQSSQPRTAPIRSLDHIELAFGAEHIERGAQLVPVYRRLMRNTPQSKRAAFRVKWIDIPKEMNRAYEKHLQLMLLCAAGLKIEVARRIQTETPELARRFAELILKMAALRNPGPVMVAKSVVERVSVLDVFGLLGKFPRRYFAAPRARHAKNIHACVRPVFSGNKSSVAKKRASVKIFISGFADLFDELMNAGADHAEKYYGDPASMRASIVARAEFENAALDRLYYKTLYEELDQAIARYRSTNDPAVVREAIDGRVQGSLRRVDGLLAQGNARRLSGGGIEMEIRIIDGIRYAVRAWNDESQTRRLHVSIPARLEGDQYRHSVPNLADVTRRQLGLLCYRFTTDGWKTSSEARARLARDEENRPSIEFDDLSKLPIVGRLEGYFYLRGASRRAGGARGNLRAYTFAIPDKHELLAMVERKL
jgi:hypothetical protein